MRGSASIIHHIAGGWVMAPIFLRKKNVINYPIHSFWFVKIMSSIIRDIDSITIRSKVFLINVQVQNFYCWKTVVLQQYAWWLTKLIASKMVEPLTKIDIKTAQLLLWISNSKEHIDAPHILYIMWISLH